MEILPLLKDLPGVSAFSTLAGFNTCTYAGAPAAQTAAHMRRLELLTGLPASRIYLPIQTHSARVAVISENSENSENSESSECSILADGLAARGRGIALGIHTADCLPLLLVDPEAQVIAAVHCGWRGTVAGIATNAVSAMISLGANPERTIAAIGPHICP
ncbi:MAG: polyphenol oxidase family protein, partial [Muribaculaceae bacterium]|nr:polyphenol oxidase family protein [Muribaculaceae bacterium]